MEQGCTGSETDSEDCLGLERKRRRERREERSPISPARTTSTKREKWKRRPEREARGGREGSPSFFFPLRSPPSPSSTSFGGQSAPFCRSNLPAQFGTAEEGEEWRKEGRKGETLESSSSSSSDPPPTHFCQQMKGHPPPSPTSPYPSPPPYTPVEMAFSLRPGGKDPRIGRTRFFGKGKGDYERSECPKIACIPPFF